VAWPYSTLQAPPFSLQFARICWAWAEGERVARTCCNLGISGGEVCPEEVCSYVGHGDYLEGHHVPDLELLHAKGFSERVNVRDGDGGSMWVCVLCRREWILWFFCVLCCVRVGCGGWGAVLQNMVISVPVSTLGIWVWGLGILGISGWERGGLSSWWSRVKRSRTDRTSSKGWKIPCS
jgi:hypothetical protein